MSDILFSLKPNVIDILVIAVVVIIALLRAKKGFFSTVKALIVFVLAVAISMAAVNFLSPVLEPKAWDAVSDSLQERFEDEISDGITPMVSPTESIEKGLKGLKNMLGIEIEDEDLPDSSDVSLSEKLMDILMAKAELLCAKLTKLLIFILCFIICTIILSVLIRGRRRSSRTAIGFVDHLLGFLFGLLEGAVLMLIVVRCCNLFNVDFFVRLSEGTKLLSWLCGGDIQQSWQQLTQFDFKSLNDIDPTKLKDEIKTLISY